MIARLLFAALLLRTVLYGEVLLNVNFDNHSVGVYNLNMAQGDFPEATWYHGMTQGRGEIVAGTAPQGRVLRMLYPAATFGPQDNAIQIKAVLGKGVDTVWASYWVMFEQGFDFVKGGKLPGLCGGDCITGGKAADGYNGWSARIMWRTLGRAVQYVYYPDESNPDHASYGEDMRYEASLPQKEFIAGTWHLVTTQIIMNTPRKSDGTIRAYFDGELALERTNVRFRDTASLKTDQFYISTFFGGSSADWAPGEDMHVSYDDFLVISEPASAPKPTALFWLSATSGRVPFTISADGSASLGHGLEHEIDFGNGIVTSGPKATAIYSDPGIYIFSYNVSDHKTQQSNFSRRVFALASTDALCGSVWRGTVMQDSLLHKTSFLNMDLTILDSTAMILLGPSRTDAPAGEHDLFGSLRYSTGSFSALNGTDRTYDSLRAYKAGPGSYRISFQCDFSAMTYNVWVNGILVGENLPRRGYAKGIGAYGCWSSKDQAALIHKVSLGSLPDDLPSALVVKRKKTFPSAVEARKGGLVLNSGMNNPAQLEIYDARGVMVKRVSADGSSGELFVPLKSKGVYFYKIRTGQGVASGSITTVQ